MSTDPGSTFDQTVELRAEQIAPQVTWGTSPGMVTGVDGRVPEPREMPDDKSRRAAEHA
ncbi:aconitase family protein, partial [Nitrospiraceae bacterium AH_259_D15_M11_P09]|nr:aconitase family protein [Nitrospiraceae bacterium AH_259_D15_M11_P09]